MLAWMLTVCAATLAATCTFVAVDARRMLKVHHCAHAAERMAWDIERQKLTAAAMQVPNPVGAARLVKREKSADDETPRVDIIGL